MQALVDSTVWIDWLRRRETPATMALAQLLERGTAWVAPVILQEIFQGARNVQQLARLEALFCDLMCADHPVTCHIEAARLYARCRWKGITPRSPHDCLIAATAVHHELPLLHDDRDFVQLTACLPRLQFFTI